MQKKYLIAKFIILFSYIVIHTIFIFWCVTRVSGLNITVLVLQSIPLLILLPGVLANHYRTYSWLCFVLIFYFIKGVEGVFISTSSPMNMVFLFFVTVMFVASMMASRWSQRLYKNIQTHLQQDD